MKLRIFRNLDDGIVRMAIFTEDWSLGDVELMEQFGEPEVNVGGKIKYIVPHDVQYGLDSSDSSGGDQGKEMNFGDEYVRILHGFPYVRRFDSRDYDSVSGASSAGNAWKDIVVDRIERAVLELRTNKSPIPTEEVLEI